MKLSLITSTALLITGLNIHAATIYDESTAADLSDLTTTPTSVGTLSLGTNTVIGTINEGDTRKADVFTFNVATGQQLISFSIDSLSTTSQNHFLAFDDALSFNSSDASTTLFASLVNSGDAGNNLLSTESSGGDFGGTGFTAPLSAGNYSVWFQETGNNEFDYSFTFTTIPEPSSTVLGLLSLPLLFRRRR